MGQLICLRFIKALVHYFGSYFCLGVYLLMLKTRIKLIITIADMENRILLKASTFSFSNLQKKQFEIDKEAPERQKFYFYCYKGQIKSMDLLPKHIIKETSTNNHIFFFFFFFFERYSSKVNILLLNNIIGTLRNSIWLNFNFIYLLVLYQIL